MMKHISVFDAKTHFSGMITEVMENREEFIVTKRGKKVARILPYVETEEVDFDDVIKALDALAEDVGKTGITADDIIEMKESGRS